MSTQKILVTGGAGYIGSHVVRQLGEAGYEVVVYDNCSTGVPSAVLYGELAIGDLADIESLYRTFAQNQFDTVLHFAASTLVPNSVVRPLDYYTNNSRNTLNLLRCCQAFGVNQLVFSSTAAVYGNPQENPVSESMAPLPINPYGRSKLMSEWMIRDYGLASGFRYVILRYFNVAGADPQMRIGQYNPKATHLIKVSCEAALGLRSSVSIFGSDFPTPDGTGIRDYIHVEDLAAAHIDALRYLQAGGKSEVLNCGYGRGYSVREAIAMVKEVSGVDFPVFEGERRAGDPAWVVAASERIREVLGWHPRYDNLKAIVETAFEWEKKLYKL
ncbi:MAG: UDP-glucose 4-epimerase GalE [Hydrococcus sp. C42_A2020_068]|uniref:UDP-glucose 4-epimerase GalE n=1 Tax=Pleurocapsa sp. PCC 7327 TaxID=118163 RepID=UPI00029FD05C|nr:UDP-glucose 4-epimerase GalE [Pleurocapsa sp. PCC 7327]AFY77586.1 UDP-glucose-4-epimerase [Pleurocapsa sp. PCC 7327]MBF2019180.1 UDP-glucose 4-epimerase GalE [Hydrococcus sp. C42_A2020_068]